MPLSSGIFCSYKKTSYFCCFLSDESSFSYCSQDFLLKLSAFWQWCVCRSLYIYPTYFMCLLLYVIVSHISLSLCLFFTFTLFVFWIISLYRFISVWLNNSFFRSDLLVSSSSESSFLLLCFQLQNFHLLKISSSLLILVFSTGCEIASYLLSLL